MKRKPGLIDPLTSQGAARGRLFIVGTPIGNLEDITLRAIRTLKEVDVIACEDTRRTQQLLKHYDIRTRTISYHEHNEMTRAPELVIDMERGTSIALVTDAGMPVISDPGFRLVHLAIRHNIPVVPVPGASAFVAALAASGMPVESFRFLGFLPAKKGARRKTLEDLKSSTKTLVFYEAPHRVVETLKDVREILGDVDIVVAREVTKVHEEFLRGTVSEVLERLKKAPVKGELTLLVSPPLPTKSPPATGGSIQKELAQVMSERSLDERAALKLVARARGISRSEAYRQLQLEKRGPQ
ncbi:MAG TPA: 16S rRNA (cytidine(1402)-2'-O)-methyltransferase [Terriglobia bacterium]|jgi:16S rRNA (cytidine1402-2'-O)-methyltransferase|nr:16S rRNA (cytidine(1402)-2'-O)-methyltransferase [Terriglobia bacterium]